MAKSLCVIIRRAPYGMIHAAEAIRLVNGGVTYGLTTAAILIDDGVYAAKDNQNTKQTGWTSLSDTLKLTLEFSIKSEDGIESRAKIYVHKESMRVRGMSERDLVEGVKVINDEELAEIIASADAVAVF